MKTLCRLTAVLLIAVAAFAADHPNTQKGFIPGDLYQFNDLDSINLYNGNLNLHIPLGQSYMVDGALSYRFGVSYSGNNWEHDTRLVSCVGEPTCPTTGNHVGYRQYHTSLLPRERKWNAGLGWLLSFGQLTITTSYSQPGGAVNGQWVDSYTSPDGADHKFHNTLHEGETLHGTTQFPTVFYTRDGTYLRVKKIYYVNPAGLTVHGWDLEFPSGEVHRFNGAGRIMHMRDRFNNMVTFTHETQNDWSPKWTITEQNGRRTHVVEFKRITVTGATQWDPQYYDVVKTVKLSSVTSSPAVYTFHYGDGEGCDPATSNACETIRISRQVPSTDPALGTTVRVPLLRSITFPDGSSYSMVKPGNVPDYDLGNQVDLSDHWTNPPENQTFSGHITGLTLPTGGKLEWTYQPYTFPEDAPIIRPGIFGGEVYGVPLHRAVGVQERRQLDAAGTVLSRSVYESRLVSLSLPLTYIPPRTMINTITAYAAPANTVISKTVNYFNVDSAVNNRGLFARPFSGDSDPENDGPSDVVNPDPQGRFLSSKIYDGSGQLQRYTYVRYEADTGGMGGENARVASQRTVYRTDGDRWQAMDNSDFDGLGHYRTSITSGNFGAGGDLRSTYTAYNKREADVEPNNGPNVGTLGQNFQMLDDDDPWVLNTYSSQHTTENGITARTIACFDWTTGFLNRQRVMSGFAPSSSDLITRFTPANGNVTRVESFGGDTQAVSTDTPVCTSSLPAPVYQTDSTYSNGAPATTTYFNVSGGAPMPFKSVDRDINAGTGLVMTSRDTAGVATVFEYDDMGRLLWSKPTGSAWTEYIYKRAGEPGYPNATVLINQRPAGNPTGTALTESKIEFDSLGRVWKEHQRMPDGAWSVRETRYHPGGWKERVSELETAPSKWTVFSDFDAFGRPGRITAPDLTESTIAYSGVRATTRTRSIVLPPNTPTNVATTEEYDAQGRLVKVTEKSGATTAASANGANVITEYGYFVGGQLSRVLMRGAEAGVIQERLFNYDRRGFLKSESHPESGIAEYTYDAGGHVRSKTLSGGSPFDLQYEYDAAGRIKRIDGRNPVYDPNSQFPQFTLPFWVMKEFEYGSDNDLAAEPDDLRKGKLQKAYRYNYPTYPNPPYGELTIRVGETYRYKDAAGRKTERTTDIQKPYGSDWTTIRSIDQKAAYTDLGMPQRITYPFCIGCTFPVRETDYTYSQGRVKTVSGFINDVTYWPNGMRNVQLHANQIADTQTVDTSGMARPGTITSALYNSCTAPRIDIEPEGGNSPVTLTVVASGNGLSYQWFKNFASITGEISSSLPVSEPGTYYVQVTNNCKTVQSRIVTVSGTTCSQPTASNATATRNSNGTVTLSVVTGGTEPQVVTWHKSSDHTHVGTGRTITVGPITSTTVWYAKVTNDCGTYNSTEVSFNIALDMPGAGLVATRNVTDASRIDVSWPATQGATSYRLERRSGSEWVEIATPSTNSYSDLSLPANKTFAYRVRVGSGLYSNADVASTMSFTAVTAGMNVQASIFDQLLGTVNSVRAAAGFVPVTWANILTPDQPGVATGGPILGAYLTSLRARMNEALQTLGVATTPYSDPDLNGKLFHAAYITQLQQRAQ